MIGKKGFQKGVVTNSTGRKKGSANVVTGRIRSLWEDMMVENIDQLKEDFQTLKPKERLELAVKVSQFILPKLQRQVMEIDQENIVRTFNFIPASKEEIENGSK